MKLYKIIAIAFVGCAVIACSKNKAVEPVSNEPAWVNDNSLPVPIEFGKVGGFELETKAAVVDANLSQAPFGIYGVNREADNIEAGKLFNETKSRLAQYESTESRLKFVEQMDGDEVKVYYPIETKCNYTFYGYHVGSQDVEGEFDQTRNSYYKTVQLDSIDVLWARADAEPIETESGPVKGFNSKYFRTARKKGVLEEKLPHLNFKHLTTAFHIRVRASDPDAAQSFLVNKVRVTNLTLTNVDTKAKLVICDKNSDNEGKLESLGEEKTDLVRDNLNVVPTSDGIEVGDGFFVLPGDYSESKLKFTLETDPEGTTQEYVIEHIPGPENGEFEVGKSYTFVIIIKSFEQIIIKASLEGWSDGFTEEVVIRTIE